MFASINNEQSIKRTVIVPKVLYCIVSFPMTSLTESRDTNDCAQRGFM